MNAHPQQTQQLPLHAWHQSQGATMSQFAGFIMPMRYTSTLDEHAHTRDAASLFDVSHMVQWGLQDKSEGGASRALQRCTVVDPTHLTQGRCSYCLMLNESAGIIDDLIVSTAPSNADHECPPFVIISNAVTRQTVSEIWHEDQQAHENEYHLKELRDRCLLALQGPKASAVIADLETNTDLFAMPAFTWSLSSVAGIPVWLSRTGYTGEDGFELSVAKHQSEDLAQRLIDHPSVAPAGLIARDSLRIEAGFALSQQDIGSDIDPIRAGLRFTVTPRQRRNGQFQGSQALRRILASKNASPLLVGIRILEKAIARSGSEVLDANNTVVGVVTSGVFSPTLKIPIALARLHSPAVNIAGVRIRGKVVPATLQDLPFVPKRPYHPPR